MGGEIAGGGDKDVRGFDGLTMPISLTEGGFDALNGVEIAIFAQQQTTERGF